MTKMIGVSLATAMIMMLVGLFWMFMWLLGTNGYSQSKGTTILVGNAVLVFLSVIVSGIASGWAAKKLQEITAWSLWVIAPLTIVGVTGVAIIALFVGSLIIIGVVGTTR